MTGLVGCLDRHLQSGLNLDNRVAHRFELGRFLFHVFKKYGEVHSLGLELIDTRRQLSIRAHHHKREDDCCNRNRADDQRNQIPHPPNANTRGTA